MAMALVLMAASWCHADTLTFVDGHEVNGSVAFERGEFIIAATFGDKERIFHVPHDLISELLFNEQKTNVGEPEHWLNTYSLEDGEKKRIEQKEHAAKHQDYGSDAGADEVLLVDKTTLHGLLITIDKDSLQLKSSGRKIKKARILCSRIKIPH